MNQDNASGAPSVNPAQEQGFPRPSISLPDAAHALSLSYNAAHRLLLIGTLTGTKRDGRWYVDRRSLDAFKRARGAEL